MDFAFKTIHEFNDYFKDEKTCYEFFELQRWGGKPVCPHCGSEKHYKVKPRGKFTDIPSYRCANRACDLPFTVRTGSIFEGSKVEFRKWLQAAYEISTSKKGISSVELATRIGVSQKTAWFLNHRIRTMLADTEPGLLVGEIEIDETYVGGKEKNKHKSKRADKTGMVHKSPMVGLLQREGKVVLKVLDKGAANRENIIPIVHKHVDTDSTIYTDGFGAYKQLKHEYKEHGVVDHGKGEYVNGNIHTNGIEGFWAIMKRGIIGIYHQVSHQHLNRYCNEFASRYNQRNDSNISRFTNIVKNAGNARITYAELTKSKK